CSDVFTPRLPSRCCRCLRQSVSRRSVWQQTVWQQSARQSACRAWRYSARSATAGGIGIGIGFGLSYFATARYHHGSMATIRVALAENHALLREGISRLVAANEDFELVGVAADLPQLLKIVGEQRPDVVVTDIRMPPT